MAQHKCLVITMVLPLSASLMMPSDEINLLANIAPIEEENNSLFEVPEIAAFPFSAIEEILFLSAVLYFSPTHWTVWINEKSYTADDIEDSTLKIIKVTNHYIEFELKDTIKKIIKLRSNQSLITIGYRIIDGDARQKQKSIQL